MAAGAVREPEHRGGSFPALAWPQAGQAGRGAVQRRRARLLGGAAEQNAEPDHWSEQPPRFSVRRRAAIRECLVRSTVPVGGCRSVLSLGRFGRPAMNQTPWTLRVERLGSSASRTAGAATCRGAGRRGDRSGGGAEAGWGSRPRWKARLTRALERRPGSAGTSGLQPDALGALPGLAQLGR